MALWAPELLLFGKEAFTADTPTIDASCFLTAMFWVLTGIELVAAVWSVVAVLKCLGEVQGFSAWKAFANALLAGGIVLIPLFAAVVLFSCFPWK
jgi:hypothetical protein